MSFFVFAAAAALGGVLRFQFERLSAHKLGERFPYGTLFANLLGSFLLGFTLSQQNWPESTTLFLLTFCGTFTTFGGFIGQTHQRMRHREELGNSLIYLVLTLGLSLFAAWLGLSS